MARAPNENDMVFISLDSEDDASGSLDAPGQPTDEAALLPTNQNVDLIPMNINARCDHPASTAVDGIISSSDSPGMDHMLYYLETPEPPAPVELVEDDHLIITEAAGLEMVVEILPDISIDYVLGILREKTTDLTRTATRCHGIISQLVDKGSYPKEREEADRRKRKRCDEDDWDEHEAAKQNTSAPSYKYHARRLLHEDFPTVPLAHIFDLIQEHKTLFKSYIVLEKQIRTYQSIATQAQTSRKVHYLPNIEELQMEPASQLPRELDAARRKVASETAKRRKAEQHMQAEADNRVQAEADGRLGECACCFDDVPLNRMISCNGSTSHFYCLECPKRQIETQMGLSKCRPKCFGVDDCNGTFARKDLQLVLDEKTFDRLEHLQQQEDLAAAGLDFLSDCPFCDFKMECPPVEIDREFRCQNDKCGKTSCRLCDKETHIPLTCKEANKDGAITLRHVVEEAMSAAMIRQCNQCKHPFIKGYGCNKMTCSRCGNVQCYVCSKNVVNYQHFGENRGRCPLQDSVENRHEVDVKKAADEAMAKVRADNPHLSDADLMIQVSDRVKKAEDARNGRDRAAVNFDHAGYEENEYWEEDFAEELENRYHYNFQGIQRPNHVVYPAALDAHPLVQRIPHVFQYVPVNPYATAPIFLYPPPTALVPQYFRPVPQPQQQHPAAADITPPFPLDYPLFGQFGEGQQQQVQQREPQQQPQREPQREPQQQPQREPQREPQQQPQREPQQQPQRVQQQVQQLLQQREREREHQQQQQQQQLQQQLQQREHQQQQQRQQWQWQQLQWQQQQQLQQQQRQQWQRQQQQQLYLQQQQQRQQNNPIPLPAQPLPRPPLQFHLHANINHYALAQPQHMDLAQQRQRSPQAFQPGGRDYFDAFEGEGPGQTIFDLLRSQGESS